MSETIHLIGIIGRAGAGKDTAAAYLASELNLHKQSFADPLYRMAAVLLEELGVAPGWSDRDRKEREIEGLGFSPRRLLQVMGTECGRSLNPDLWLKVIQRTWAALRAGEIPRRGLVIPDVRFTNEADWIVSQGGRLIRIERPGLAPVAAHASEETDWSPYAEQTFTVFNQGTLAELYAGMELAMGMELP